MAAWGWLALLAIPGWLLWVGGLGYAVLGRCVEGDQTHPSANTEAAKEACYAQAPAPWAPFRGVRFGTPLATGELWVAGLAAAIVFAGVVVYLARRAGRRRHQQRQQQQQPTM